MRSARAWLRWRLAHAFGRNPLVRVSDRVELAAVVVAVAVSIVMIPVACAIGGAVTEAQAGAHAEQGQAQAAAGDPCVSARGSADSSPSMKALAVIGTEGVAINDDCPRVSPPTTAQQARIDGALAGMTVWVLVGSCAVGLVALVRRWITRMQEASWDWDAAFSSATTRRTAARRRSPRSQR
jgi:hypothetical protein